VPQTLRSRRRRRAEWDSCHLRGVPQLPRHHHGALHPRRMRSRGARNANMDEQFWAAAGREAQGGRFRHRRTGPVRQLAAGRRPTPARAGSARVLVRAGEGWTTTSPGWTLNRAGSRCCWLNARLLALLLAECSCCCACAAVLMRVRISATHHDVLGRDS
jgi:hypothetical protein